MNHGLFPELVSLDLDSHVYTNKVTGQIYKGFSSVFGTISKPFFTGIAKKVAEKECVPVSEVQSRWDAQRDEGTKIDDALTEYSRTGIADAELKPSLDIILAHYKHFNQTHEQLVVYNNQYGTATAIDKLGMYSNRKDSCFSVSDWKCFEKMELHDHRGWLKEPFSHLPDTKFTRICFQLSYGAWHFEELTGKRCKKLFIHLIQPSTVRQGVLNQQIIPVPYIKHDIFLLLEHYSNQKNSILASNQESIF